MTIVLDKNKFNQEFYGVYGEFGQGGGAQIFFIQTVLKPKHLDKITLVGDIEGSEKWDVRDLFQRDVDTQRVSHGLVPYLLDQDAIKFFSPLTLTLITPSDQKDSFTSSIPKMNLYSEEIKGHNYKCIENKSDEKSLFRFRHIENSEENGLVEWNDSETKLVAIDGQHRVTALKHIVEDSKAKQIDFENWSIPIVIFGVRSIDKQATEEQRTLDVIRRIFVNINSKGVQPTVTRQILLNDTLPNEICTQEFVNYFHSNDCLDEPDPAILPLLIFNWRGAEKNSRTDHTPGSFKTIEEIRDWFKHYILGENWSTDQQNLLGVKGLGNTQEIKAGFKEKNLKPSSIKLLRELFTTNVLPGVTMVLQEFTPIKEYCKAIRVIEHSHNHGSVDAHYAFHKFRFGNQKGVSLLKGQTKTLEDEIEADIVDKYSRIPTLLTKDIGMRGVMYAYGAIFKELNFSNFIEYSAWFVARLNEIYSEGWLGLASTRTDAAKKRLLRHICYNHTDEVINYKLEDSGKALGCLLTVVMISKNDNKNAFLNSKLVEAYKQNALDRIRTTLVAGYKKEVRPAVIDSLTAEKAATMEGKVLTSSRIQDIQSSFPPKMVNAKIKELSEEKAQIHLDDLEKALASEI